MSAFASHEDARDASPTTAFVNGLVEGSIRLQRCDVCLKSIFPPRVMCPHCYSSAVSHFDSNGLGEVYASTTIPVRDGPGRTVLLVDLDDGVRIMGSVFMMGSVFDDESAPRIGDRVQAKAIELDEQPLIAIVAEGS